MVGVGGVDRAKDVGVDLVLLQAFPAADHVVEAALPALGDAEGLMHIARPVDADADEIVVLLEEFRPFVVDQRAVGLERVEHAHARPARPNGGRSQFRAASARRPATTLPPAARARTPSTAGWSPPARHPT